MEALKKFCEVIRIRRVNADFTTTTCPLCGANFRGYDALQSHIFADHKVVLPPFDDIEDIDGFLALVKSLCTEGGVYKCLHSQATFASLAELEAYLASTAVSGATIAAPESRLSDCRFWTWDTVPQFTPFRFYTPDANDADDDAEEAAINETTAGAFVPMGDDEIAIEGTRVVEDGCGSSKIECPYCSDSSVRYASDDFTAHLLSAHRIDNFAKMLKAFRSVNGGPCDDCSPDFHDMIRLVNMIREKADDALTPYSNIAIDEKAGADMATTLLAEAAALTSSEALTPAQLAKVYVVSPEAFAKLLADAPNEDYYLIPKRTSDELITYLLHTDDGDDEGEEDEEAFPMVPTLREAADAKKEAARPTDSDSD